MRSLFVCRSANLLAVLALAVGAQVSAAHAASPKPVKNYNNYVPGSRCLKMLGRDGNYEVCGNDKGGKTVRKLPSKV